MRMLFERDLTPHPQYAAFYKWMQKVGVGVGGEGGGEDWWLCVCGGGGGGGGQSCLQETLSPSFEGEGAQNMMGR